MKVLPPAKRIETTRLLGALSTGLGCAMLIPAPPYCTPFHKRTIAERTTASVATAAAAASPAHSRAPQALRALATSSLPPRRQVKPPHPRRTRPAAGTDAWRQVFFGLKRLVLSLTFSATGDAAEEPRNPWWDVLGCVSRSHRASRRVADLFGGAATRVPLCCGRRTRRRSRRRRPHCQTTRQRR